MLHIFSRSSFHLQLRYLLSYLPLGEESLGSLIDGLKLASGTSILRLSDLTVFNIETEQPVSNQIFTPLRSGLVEPG